MSQGMTAGKRRSNGNLEARQKEFDNMNLSDRRRFHILKRPGSQKK